MRITISGVLAFLAIGLLPQVGEAQGVPAPILGKVSCTNGFAAGYPCKNVDLLAYLPRQAAGLILKDGNIEGEMSGSWGWTDAASGREFILAGISTGTSFIEITNPEKPVYLGILPIPAGTVPNIWREIKTYQHYALIVGDAAGPHGMQVFDLHNLLNVSNPPTTFTETARYTGAANVHDIVVNEESGYAYLVGTNGSSPSCGGGLHMVDIRNPLAPKFAGCFSEPRTGRAGTGYIHDAQCVNYKGPDTRYSGREICFCYAETAVNIVDVTDKSSPKSLSITVYPNVGYVHQGWASPDHRYIFVDDEFDESRGLTNNATRTIIMNIEDLQRPLLAKEYFSLTSAVDHNQYVKGRYLYQANYTAGLRILDVLDPNNPKEIGYFDCFPNDDSPIYEGAWNVYAYHKNGVISMNCIGQGVYVVRPQTNLLATDDETPQSPQIGTVYPNPFQMHAQLKLTLERTEWVNISVFDVLGRQVSTLHSGVLGSGVHEFPIQAQDWPGGRYLYKIQAGKSAHLGSFVLNK